MGGEVDEDALLQQIWGERECMGLRDWERRERRRRKEEGEEGSGGGR